MSIPPMAPNMPSSSPWYRKMRLAVLSRIPMDVPAMFNLYRNDVEIKELDVSIVSTVILDNVSEMRVYNADERVRSYLEFLNGIAERNGTGLRLIYFRRPGDPGAKDFAGSLGLEHVEIPDSVFR